MPTAGGCTVLARSPRSPGTMAILPGDEGLGRQAGHGRREGQLRGGRSLPATASPSASNGSPGSGTARCALSLCTLYVRDTFGELPGQSVPSAPEPLRAQMEGRSVAGRGAAGRAREPCSPHPTPRSQQGREGSDPPGRPLAAWPLSFLGSRARAQDVGTGGGGYCRKQDTAASSCGEGGPSRVPDAPAHRGAALPRLLPAGGAPRGVRAGITATPRLPSPSGQGRSGADASAGLRASGSASPFLPRPRRGTAAENSRGQPRAFRRQAPEPAKRVSLLFPFSDDWTGAREGA